MPGHRRKSFEQGQFSWKYSWCAQMSQANYSLRLLVGLSKHQDPSVSLERADCV